MKQHHEIRFRWVWAAAAGLLTAAAFPKIGFDYLAWFSVIPLFIAINGLSGWKRFRLGFLAGFIHYIAVLYWVVYVMHEYGHLQLVACVPILLLFSLYLALYFGLFTLIAGAWRSPAAFALQSAALWTALEYIRAHLLTGFPWALMGHAFYRRLHLIQISDIVGAYGVSFAVVLVNAAFFLFLVHIQRGRWGNSTITPRHLVISGGVAVIVLAVSFGYGIQRLEEIRRLMVIAPKLTVSVVQGNIDQSMKWNRKNRNKTIEKYIRLSRKAARRHPRLIVWPETAAPFYYRYNAPLTRQLNSGIRNIDADFLIGAPSFDKTGDKTRLFNSAYLVEAPTGRILGTYEKVHLVPYGEYVPFKKWMPFLGKLVAEVGDFSPGKKGDTISRNGYTLGVLICYEIIFPRLSRALVKNGADLLVNITNDAWFGRTSAAYQHFSTAVFRAVENKRTLVRSANTGISGFIDPTGRIRTETQLFVADTKTIHTSLMHIKTIYTKYGDVFAFLCLAASFINILTINRFGRKTS